jgi:CBS domain-containing membrane protein
MKVRDCMTRKVFTIPLGKKALAVKEIMEWAHIRHVPVVDAEGKLAGMVSHRDVLHASLASIAERVADAERRRHLWTVSIERIMRTPVETIGPDERVQDAARRMRAGKIGCLPVVEGGKLVGIITEHDLLGLIERI